MARPYAELVDEILDGPVVGGFLDDDFYTFSMGQVIVSEFPDVEVEYQLINRSSSIKLAQEVDPQELADELDRLKTQRLTRTEMHYLNGTNEYGNRLFTPEYIDHEWHMRRPEFELSVTDAGQFQWICKAPWKQGIHWEVPGLATVNGLRTRTRFRKMKPFERDAVIARGILKLEDKITNLRQYPSLTFCDFGTRRRFHRAWQRYINERLAEELPGQYLGTSNVESAMHFGQLPMGTNAHQFYMVIAALLGDTDESLRRAHNKALQIWWKHFGWGLSIALTDTFGTDFFFQDFTPEQAREWKGLRQDSGDPFEFGRKALAFYRKHKINPLDKLLIFSDGLTDEVMVQLWVEFNKEIKVSSGWGTHLTNDLGFSTASLVIKTMRARWNANSPWIDTCKLSDNLDKALGLPEVVDHYKRVFGYTSTFAEQPIV